jgi:hypothetical protein
LEIGIFEKFDGSCDTEEIHPVFEGHSSLLAKIVGEVDPAESGYVGSVTQLEVVFGMLRYIV